MDLGGLELKVDRSGGSRDQIKRIIETVELYVQVPAIKFSEELGSIIQRPTEIGQHKPKDRVNGRREVAIWRRQQRSLDHVVQ